MFLKNVGRKGIMMYIGNGKLAKCSMQGEVRRRD